MGMHYLNLIVATLALFPSIMLYFQYKQLKLADLLLFSLFFLMASVSMYSSFFAPETDKLILYQIHNISWVLTFYLLQIHSLRIKWEAEPSLLRVINKVWTLFLVLTILLWEKQIQHKNTNVLFIDMPHSHSSYFPNEAGTKIGTRDALVVLYATFYRESIAGFATVQSTFGSAPVCWLDCRDRPEERLG